MCIIAPCAALNPDWTLQQAEVLKAGGKRCSSL